MASQEVIEKLGKLQAELEKVSNAVKHIDKASKVADTAAGILKKIPELLAELKSVEEKHRKDLQKDLKEKIDVIEKQLHSLLTDFEEKAKQLSQVIKEAKKLEKAINNYIVELRKINFPERLDRIEQGFEDTNQNLRSGFSSINDSIKHSQEKITNDIIKNLTEENQLLKKEVKTNRIIQIVGLTIILIILIYIATK